VPNHDAAHVKWGGDWRMPTKQELEELYSKCNWIRMTMNGVSGYVVRGKGDYVSASIFLPAAGYGDGASLRDVGSSGNYWSSVPDSGNDSAWGLNFFSSYLSPNNYGRRSRGRSIRPVQEFTK
jgi:hypothetical protein